MQAEGFSATRVCRYPHSLSTFNLSKLIVCGDIKLNPGLDNESATCKPAWKFPCDVCTKTVRSNQKGIVCDGCNKWFHLNCINMELWKYLELSSSVEPWFCNGNCGWPFNFSDSIFDLSTSVHDDAGENERVSLICSPSRHSSGSFNGFPKCLFLNVRSLRGKIEDLHAYLIVNGFF